VISIHQTSNSGKQLVFNASNIYILRENDERITVADGTILNWNNQYFRVTLNFDGIFTLYFHPKTSAGNESWTAIWSVPDNICQDNPGESMTGVCGYNLADIFTKPTASSHFSLMRTKLNIVCHLSRLRGRNSASDLDGNNSHTIATNHATAIANKETHWTAPSQATATTYKEIKISQGAPRIRSSNG
jgi:hypothetical protein